MKIGFSKFDREYMSSRLPIPATMKYLKMINSKEIIDFSEHPDVVAARSKKKADSKVDKNVKVEEVKDWEIGQLTPQQMKKRLKNRKRREKKKLKKLKKRQSNEDEKHDECEIIESDLMF